MTKGNLGFFIFFLEKEASREKSKRALGKRKATCKYEAEISHIRFDTGKFALLLVELNRLLLDDEHNHHKYGIQRFYQPVEIAYLHQ